MKQKITRFAFAAHISLNAEILRNANIPNPNDAPRSASLRDTQP
jgi:hypothetical protein